MQHSHCYDLAAFLIGKQELSYEALPGLDARGSKLEGTWILLNGRQDQLFYILERSISPLQVQTIYLEEWQDQLGVASILFGGMRELLDANQGRSVDGTSSLYSWPSLHQRFISERKAASFLQHHRNIPGRNVLLCQAKLLQGPLLHLQGGCALHSNDTTGLGTRESEGDLQDHNSARSCEASKLQQCSCLIWLACQEGSFNEAPVSSQLCTPLSILIHSFKKPILIQDPHRACRMRLQSSKDDLLVPPKCIGSICKCRAVLCHCLEDDLPVTLQLIGSVLKCSARLCHSL
mmetsp:Transcript_15005/g.35333  ORF Transcript_15005/g.35333 Transcript_15005/m.35333 type:complete len:291 (-) Transcript_15005:758-1630(-)